VADLADPTAVGGLVGEAAAALGSLTLLVNSAALFESDDVGRLNRADWDRQLAVNLAAPVFLAEAFAAQLAAPAEGNIVNIIDQRAWKPTPLFFSYQIAKSALWTATRTLAQALAPRIRVNAIGPGPALKSPRQSEADFRKQTAAVPLGHGPEIGEFGRTVRYFVEARAVTGQMIALDGGQHLAWRTPDVTVAPE
jgi:NAD(P)-dependent dehydrogenase (short-subunit alcohol dehydrogenase family)